MFSKGDFVMIVMINIDVVKMDEIVMILENDGLEVLMIKVKMKIKIIKILIVGKGDREPADHNPLPYVDRLNTPITFNLDIQLRINRTLKTKEMAKEGANAPQVGDVIENGLTGNVETVTGVNNVDPIVNDVDPTPAASNDPIVNDVTGLEIGTRAYFNAITKGVKVLKTDMVAVVLESRETKGNAYTGSESTFKVKLQYRVKTINALGEEMKQLRTARLVSQTDKEIGSIVMVNLANFVPVSHSYLMDYVPGMTGARFIDPSEGVIKIVATSADFMPMATARALLIEGELYKTETGFAKAFELPVGYEPAN